MKDLEIAPIKTGFAPKSKARSNFAPKTVLTTILVTVVIVGTMFGIGMLASHFERSVNSNHEMSHATTAFNQKTELGHQLVPRGKEGRDNSSGFIGVETAVSIGSSAFVSPTESEEGIRVPVSTQTAYETFYTIIKTEETTTLTSTSTEQVVVTPSDVLEETVCGTDVVTTTKTSFVTVTHTPTPSASTGYATVTGKASTVTDVNTDIPYTSELPDITVSANPSTLTDVQTDISYTSGLPDVTVSGSPSTVTEVGVSYSLLNSVSRALTSTVTVTVTNIWGTYSETIATTETPTMSTTPVVVFISDLYPTASVTDEASSYEGYYTSSAKGGGMSYSSGVTAPYPANGTVIINPSGTVAALPVPTTTPIVSGSAKKPEPRGLVPGHGSSHFGYAVMLIAAVMFML